MQVFIHVSGYLNINHNAAGYVKAGEIHTIEVPYGVTALDVDGDANGASLLEDLEGSEMGEEEECDDEIPCDDATDYVADMVDYCMDMEER